jgi:hypothetical protein
MHLCYKWTILTLGCLTESIKSEAARLAIVSQRAMACEGANHPILFGFKDTLQCRG